ncbi:hypothetical protein SLEP1_g32010 [Rubroshorea leprosula]|uniref:Uncharacterized protein n=2 Tax=Rubroshorea leprosula TaxID=152421 RepID=A0AAV5KC67_9ROSI|nr:hypothetical protein SLEP1_g32010 [Rubroshorea leprosula]
MSNSGGFAVIRTHLGDRFYNPPPVRRHQQLLLLQQQQQLQKQLQRPVRKESRVNSADVATDPRTDSDDSTLSRPDSGYSASSPTSSNLTNLDRLMESVTPFVLAQYFSEGRMRGRRMREVDIQPFFSLGDLWECYSEWSVYGVGVPLLLNGSESVKQYYVPSLSGIQLYIDPHRPRRPGEDTEAESSRETSSGGSSDCAAERQCRSGFDGAWGQLNIINSNSQRMNRLTLRDKPPVSSSSDEAEVSKSPGMLVYEYFEQEQPHQRKPLYDKILSLAGQFPDLRKYRSSDLLPSSWISVAWYPIYRIPMGPTLQNLDASFLTFHSLSTHSRSKNQLQYLPSGDWKVSGVDASPKFSLPVFGLASYKLRGSILTANGGREWQQANSLMQTADNWLQHLQVNLPDFQFFVSHNSRWR